MHYWNAKIVLYSSQFLHDRWCVMTVCFSYWLLQFNYALHYHQSEKIRCLHHSPHALHMSHIRNMTCSHFLLTETETTQATEESNRHGWRSQSYQSKPADTKSFILRKCLQLQSGHASAKYVCNLFGQKLCSERTICKAKTTFLHHFWTFTFGCRIT